MAIDIKVDAKFSSDQIGEAVRQIVVEIIANHSKYLYVEGAAIIDHRGKLLLLVGTTRAGKSTLSASLALGLGWKILTEDLVIFDQSNKYILPLKLPISLRSGAKELIKEATGLKPKTKGESDVWMDMGSLSVIKQVPARFDRVVLLEAPGGQELVSYQLLPEQALRLILPASNALHFPDGIENLMDMIRTARCYRLTGGSVKERIEAVKMT